MTQRNVSLAASLLSLLFCGCASSCTDPQASSPRSPASQSNVTPADSSAGVAPISTFTPTQFSWGQARVTIDSSWLNYPRGYSYAAQEIRTWFPECTGLIRQYLGNSPAPRDCIVKYQPGDISMASGGGFELTAHWDLVSTTNPTGIVLAVLDKTTFTHELVHFLVGNYCSPDSGFNEGLTEAVTQLATGSGRFDGMNQELRLVLENLIDLPEVRQITWNIETGLAIGWLPKNNHIVLGNLRYALWSSLLREYEEAHPGFIRRFFDRVFASSPSMSVSQQQDLAEQAQAGFTDWYRSQPAFQSSRPGSFFIAKMVEDKLLYVAFTRTLQAEVAAMSAVDRPQTSLPSNSGGITVIQLRAAMVNAPLERRPTEDLRIELIRREGRNMRTSQSFPARLPSPVGLIMGFEEIEPGTFLYGEAHWGEQVRRFELQQE